MLTKFKVTYSNNGKQCSLPLSVVTLFADNENEARQLCEDLHWETKEFYIDKVEKVKRGL